MKSISLNEARDGLREFVRRGAEVLVEEMAQGMEDEIVGDQDLQRYGQQLQSLLNQTELRLRDEDGHKNGEQKPESEEGAACSQDMSQREGACEEADVTETNPENVTLCDIPGHPVSGVSERGSEKVTLCDISGHDSSAEAIEAFAEETSKELVDVTDPTTQIDRRQLLAISGLLCGSTINSTANQIGVHRRTVHRWMHDAKFQAAYRYCEAELRMAAQAQVAGLAEKAVRCVSESLDRGNAHIGMELLKLLHVFSVRATPDRIVEAQEKVSLLDVVEES